MKKWIAVICAAAILAGCANAPIRLANEDATRLQSVPSDKLCGAYFLIGQQKFIDELKRRQAFADADLQSIETHSLRVGMTESAALCVRGHAYTEHTALQDQGVKQLHYWDHRGGDIYIKDGSVASFSN